MMPQLRRVVCAVIMFLFCFTGVSLAVEAPGSPFTYDAGGSSTARAYSGIVGQSQNVLVAYERDVSGPSTCSVQGFSVADLTTALNINGITPQHGTVSFSTAPNQLLDAVEGNGTTCVSGPWSAGSIYYEADADYIGTDYFRLVLVGGDIIDVNIAVTGELGGVATITPMLLQSSVKQTTSMISSRVKRVIIPRTLFKDRSTARAPQNNITTPDDTTLAPKDGKRSLADIVAFSIDNETIGLSAGDASMKHGIWTNIAYTSAEDDNLISESDMDINSYIMGYDYKLSDSMAIGVAVTYEKIDADLNFNSGSLDGDGYTISPYFSMLLTDYLAMDVIGGYGIIDYDQDRNFGTVTSSVDADRQFIEFSLNGFHYIDQWSLNVNLSFLYAHEGQDSYTESDGTTIKSNNVDFSQLSIGTELAYSFKHIEPYITLAYERDTQYVEINNSDYDKSGGDGGLGLRLFFSDQLSGDIYGSTKFGRDNYDEYSVLGNLRYDF